jgi:serine/threonine protein kinase
MIPNEMLDRVEEEQRSQFFDRDVSNSHWTIKQREGRDIVAPSTNPRASLIQVLEEKINTNQQNIKTYEMFVDLLHRMLAYNPEDRITPEECLLHPFIVTEQESRHLTQS